MRALILAGMAIYAVALFAAWALMRAAAMADSEFPAHPHDDEIDAP